MNPPRPSYPGRGEARRPTASSTERPLTICAQCSQGIRRGEPYEKCDIHAASASGTVVFFHSARPASREATETPRPAGLRRTVAVGHSDHIRLPVHDPTTTGGQDHERQRQARRAAE